MTATIRPCALIPTFNNPETLDRVSRAARAYLPTLVVDDGSGPEALSSAKKLASETDIRVYFRPKNGGKGACVLTGLELARSLGYTHVIQLDADGQHDPEDIPRFLEASERNPLATVLGQPQFDESAPKLRVYARKISVFWVALETMSRAIGDPLCGFRVYPIDETLRASAVGARMDFDLEIVVRLAWNRVPIVHVPVKVRYFSRDEGGVSHFHPWLDTLRISAMHTRLCIVGLLRLIGVRTAHRALPPRDAS